MATLTQLPTLTMDQNEYSEPGLHQKCPDCRLYKNHAGLCQCTTPQNPFYSGANNSPGDPRPRYMRTEEKYALECTNCGKLCFHDKRRADPPSESGYGLCKECGGRDIISRSKEIQRHRVLYPSLHN
jgi:hypothetical protein